MMVLPCLQVFVDVDGRGPSVAAAVAFEAAKRTHMPESKCTPFHSSVASECTSCSFHHMVVWEMANLLLV